MARNCRGHTRRVGRTGNKMLLVVITFNKAHSSNNNHTTSAMSSGVGLKEETHHITMCKSSNDGTARVEVGFIVGEGREHSPFEQLDIQIHTVTRVVPEVQTSGMKLCLTLFTLETGVRGIKDSIETRSWRRSEAKCLRDSWRHRSASLGCPRMEGSVVCTG